MLRPKLYIITGMSGSGKTTIARALLEHGEVAFDSRLNPGLYYFVDADGKVADDIKLHDIKLHDIAWRAQYKWRLNETALELLLAKYNQSDRLYLCGRANLFEYWHKADQVFLLKVDEHTLIKRLNDPTRDNLFAKDATTQQQLVNDLPTIQDKIMQTGAIAIDADQPIGEVVTSILAASDLLQ